MPCCVCQSRLERGSDPACRRPIATTSLQLRWRSLCYRSPSPRYSGRPDGNGSLRVLVDALEMGSIVRRVVKWVLALDAAVTLTLLGIIVWVAVTPWDSWDTKPPADSALFAHYKRHLNAFGRVAQLLRSQSRGLNVSDVARLRQLIALPRDPETTDVPPSPGNIHFPIGEYGSFRRYEVKGFAYCQQTPPAETRSPFLTETVPGRVVVRIFAIWTATGFCFTTRTSFTLT